MKEGAEDLWNEDDGPPKSPPTRPRKLSGKNPPLDLRKIVSDRRNLDSFGLQHRPSSGSEESNFDLSSDRRKTLSDGSDESNLDSIRAEGRIFKGERAIGQQLDPRMIGSGRRSFSSIARRNYSVEARIPVSRFESRVKRSPSNGGGDDKKFDLKTKGNSRRWRFSHGDSDEDSDSDSEGRVFRKNMMSSAALRNYDMKMIKRQRPKAVEEENESSDEIQTIRDELKRRGLDGNAERQCEEESSLLSQKRYIDEGIMLLG